MSNRRLTLDLILSTIDKASAPLRRVMRGSSETAKALKEAKDKLAGLQRQQKDISSFQQLSRATKTTRNELGAASENYRRLQRQMEATANPSRKLTREFERAGDKVGQLRNKHIRHLQTLQQAKRKLAEAGIDVRDLSQHNLRLSQDIDTATEAMRRQQRELDRLTRRQERARAAAEQFSATQEMAGKIAGAGAGAIAMGGGITYGAAQVIQPGMEFDAAMSQVQALTRLNKESEEYIALRKQARDLGATTSFSASDAAAGQGYLAMAGFTPQAIVDAMPGMLSLAKAAGVELGEAADIGSNILTGFEMKASEMGRAGDVLVGTFTRGNVDLQMLGETMKYVGPVASGLGGTLEEVAAMADKLGDAGTQASMAGTAMRAIYSRMAAPPKAAAAAMEELGLHTKDAMGNLRPMPDLLKELHAKTKDLGNAERTGVFKALAGEEAASALKTLVGEAGNGELQKLIATLQNDTQGEAQKTAAVMADNAAGDIKSLQSAFQDVAIELTDLNDGPLRGTIQMVTGVVRGVGDWIKANPELAGTIAKVVVITGALLLGFGSIALAVSALMGPFAILRYVMTMAGISSGGLGTKLLHLGKTALPLVGKGLLWIGRLAMANPIGLLVTAIAGAAYLIYKNWAPIKQFFVDLWGKVSSVFNVSLGDILTTLVNWSPWGIFYSAIQQGLGMLGIELPATFSEFGGNMIQGLIDGITNMIPNVKEKISAVGESVSGWFKDVLGINSPSRVFTGHGGDVMAGLQLGLGNGEGGVLDGMIGIGSRLIDKGREIAAKLKDTLGNLKNTALDKLGAAGGWLREQLGMETGSQPALAGGGGIQLDTRPALQPRNNTTSGGSLSIGEIHVHAAPGMDAEAVARLVAQEIQRLQLQQAAGTRSQLRDED